MIKSVAVYCGSSSGDRPIYLTSAQLLGEKLAANNITTVYGGAQIGIMGAVANSCMAAGGQVIGVIPEFLAKKEIAHDGLTELFVVDTMHERKLMMIEKSDAFVILPGGYGTLEELFEVVTWSQLDLHQKPVFVLNIDGYYDALRELIAKANNSGFLRSGDDKIVQMIDNVEDLITALTK